MSQIICGNALTELKKMPDETVNCIITSPPYYGLRDYGLEPIIWDGGDEKCVHEWGHLGFIKGSYGLNKDFNKRYSGYEGNGKKQEDCKPKIIDNGNTCSLCNAWKGCLGLEPDFNLYLDHLIMIFGECKRVLRKDGTMWINIGDSYSGNSKENGEGVYRRTGKNDNTMMKQRRVTGQKNVPAKSLLGIPERLVIRLTDELNLIRRNTIIWYKPNCIPSSCKDRFTVDFEYVYLFTRSGKYAFERQFENHQSFCPKRTFGNKTNLLKNNRDYRSTDAGYNNPLGRNMRTVWRIPSHPYKEAHFATYPEELVRRCIKAGCPEYVCTKCGKAKEKIFTDGDFIKTGGKRIKDTPGISELQKNKGTGFTLKIDSSYISCSCSAPFAPGIILDPFAGSGTTGAVTKELNRDFILIEQNPEYIKLIDKRLRNTVTQLTVEL